MMEASTLKRGKTLSFLKIREQNGIMIGEFWDSFRLDAELVKMLRTQYQERDRECFENHLIADFKGVSFAGTSAFAVLKNLSEVVKQQGGRFVLAELEDFVLESLRLSGLEPFFNIGSTVKEALAMVRNEGDDPSACRPSPNPNGLGPKPNTKPKAGPLTRQVRRSKPRT